MSSKRSTLPKPSEKGVHASKIHETSRSVSQQSTLATPSTEKETNSTKTSENSPQPSVLSKQSSLSPTKKGAYASFIRSSFTPSASSTNNQPTILGYVKNVGPTKDSAKGSQYFSFTIQEKETKLKALCFSPKKHKSNIAAKAESGSPCKITKFNRDPKDDKVVWINYHTVVDEAPETMVDFSQDHVTDQGPPLVSTKDVNTIKVFETVCARGLVIFGDNKPQPIPNKKHLTKLEGCLIDETGSIPITIWNEHIELVQDRKFYNIQNMVVKQYFGQKFLSSTSSSEFTVTEDLPLSDDVVKEAEAQLKNTEVRCSSFRSVDIITYYNCLNCGKRLPFRQDSVVLKCKNCLNYCLIKNSTKTVTARVSAVLPNNSDPVFYSLFPASLEAILKQHHLKYGGEVYDINSIEEDKLSEIILMLQNVKLEIKNDKVEHLTFE